MDWLRRSLCRIKRSSGISRAKPTIYNQSQNNKSQHLKRKGKFTNLRERNTSWSYSSDNVFHSEEVSSVQNIFQRLGMRLKKDYKIRNREGARATVKPEILKIRKTHNKSFKSPIVRPQRVKSKSSWVQRLLSKSGSNNNNDQDVAEHFRAVEIEVEEAVDKVYNSQFMHSEHFNFVGEDKNLGPLVLSIKYPNQTVDEGRQKLKMASVPDKTILLLRLPTGLVKHTWNQFQLSKPSMKSPLDLAKLSFPNLSVSRLLPVLSPEVSQLISEYDMLSGEETRPVKEDLMMGVEKKSMELKELQEKLLTSTCKYIELSDWNLEEYNNFFTKKKISLPKYLSFTMPVTLKTPKSCSRSVNRVKSPKFMSLPKRILQFEDDQDASPPPPLDLKSDEEIKDHNQVRKGAFLPLPTIPHSSEAVVTSSHMVDLSGQMVKLSTDDPVEEAVATDTEANATDDDDTFVKMMMTMVKLKLEKDELSETNAELEREKEELGKNGRRLVRELATAHTIIDSLKKRL